MHNGSQQGSSLIEVMVALFVLAIGLLGILAMQTKSMQYNQSADTYARAMFIANDIAERIRANPKKVNTYTTTTVPETAPTSCIASDFTNIACTDANLVSWDLYNWSQTISSTLPLGVGAIAKKTLGTQDYVQITVSFDDTRSDQDANAVSRKKYTLLVEYPKLLGGA